MAIDSIGQDLLSLAILLAFAVFLYTSYTKKSVTQVIKELKKT